MSAADLSTLAAARKEYAFARECFLDLVRAVLDDIEKHSPDRSKPVEDERSRALLDAVGTIAKRFNEGPPK